MIRRELHKRVSAYMLRRTQEVLSKHLPPLAVHTMFCKPSPLQVSLSCMCVVQAIAGAVHIAVLPQTNTSCARS